MKSKKFNYTVVFLIVANIIFTGFVGYKVLDNHKTDNSEYSTRYTLYVGTNDKDTYKPEMSLDDAKKKVDEVCFKYVEGYTVSDANGFWMDEKKNITKENTIVVTLSDVNDDTVHKISDELREKLNQNSILIETSQVKDEFYGAE